MNIFRLLGDLVHLSSILVLLWKVLHVKNAAGISLKSVELYAVVFSCRYLDIFWNFASMYNYIMKLIFLASTFGIIYVLRVKHSTYYDRTQDQIDIRYILGPCAVLGLIFTDQFTFSEILWAFSIFLEAVAIIPQLYLLQRTGEVENLTADYIATLGGYRALYILNWIYRYATEEHYRQGKNYVVWICGLVQTVIYCDFFYYYWKSRMQGKKMELPA
eukprot:tig00000829_g4659.t1